MGLWVTSNLHLLASFFCTRGEISPNLENSSEHPRASESIWRYLQVSTCIFEHLPASMSICKHLLAFVTLNLSGNIKEVESTKKCL